MKVLFIGDIVGQPGREVLAGRLSVLKESEKPDLTIANAENAAGGKGLTRPVANELFDYGIDVLTLGNHAFDRREVADIIHDPRVLRPANYPPNVPGNGFGVYQIREDVVAGVVSLMGRVYLPDTDCPFRTANHVLEKIGTQTKIIIVDFHAEVTSEKQAMGWYLDGRTSAVIGTHTHVPTADERILPGGTAYLTDAGMTGPADGVIGMDREIVIKKFLTVMPQPFVVAGGPGALQGCVVDIDSSSGRATDIRRISLRG